MEEVVGREEHLPRDDLVLPEHGAHAFEEPGLTDRGDRLQRADVGGAAREAERGHARRDRARHDEHDAAARRARAARSSPSFTSAVSSSSPDGNVIDDVPIFTTEVVLTSLPRR